MGDDLVAPVRESQLVEAALEPEPSVSLNSKMRSWIRKSGTSSPSMDLMKTGAVLLLTLFIGTSAATSLKLTLFAPKIHSDATTTTNATNSANSTNSTNSTSSGTIQRAGVGTRVEVQRSLAHLNGVNLHRSKTVVVQVPSTLPLTGSSTPSYSTASTSPPVSTVPSYSSVPTTTAPTPSSVATTVPATSPTTLVKEVPPKSPKEPKPIKVIPPKSPKE